MEALNQIKPVTTYTAEQRHAFIVAWQKSGLSKVEFSRQNHIKPSAFYAWANHVPASKNPPKITTSTLLPVKPIAMNEDHAHLTRHIEILIRKQCIIRIPMPSSTQGIIELVQGLAACAPSVRIVVADRQS